MTDLTCENSLAAEDIHRADHGLARLTAHLRTGPDWDDAAALLTPLVHADHGLIARLTQVLREVARLLTQHADVPWDATVTCLVHEYLDAATTVDQLRHPLNETLRVLERSPVRTGHGNTWGSSRCR